MKHDRHSIRLKKYDYSSTGYYFVTICTQDKKCLFGDVVKNEIRLNLSGEIVHNEWLKTQKLRPNVELDEYVIMPNHLHAILRLKCRGTARRAPTLERFGYPVVGSLSTIIRSFKSAVSNQIHAIPNMHDTVVWQRNYYERVIRDEQELFEIRKYVQENPLKWDLDPENIGRDKSRPYRSSRGTARRAPTASDHIQ